MRPVRSLKRWWRMVSTRTTALVGECAWYSSEVRVHVPTTHNAGAEECLCACATAKTPLCAVHRIRALALFPRANEGLPPRPMRPRCTLRRRRLVVYTCASHRRRARRVCDFAHIAPTTQPGRLRANPRGRLWVYTPSVDTACVRPVGGRGRDDFAASRRGM